METVIGLGKSGCLVAEQFAKYDQYKIYKIDVGLEGIKRTGYGDFPQDGIYSIPEQESAEAYEENCPDMEHFFKDVKGEVLFVVNGAEFISAASLRVLESLKKIKCSISILYIRPDMKYISEINQMNQRVTFNVLQEYTRSGVFERIFLIDMPTIEAFMEDVPLSEYHERIYGLVSSAFHMINVYGHIDSVSDTFFPPHEAARISTIGVSNSEDEVELFFPLDEMDEIRYYYAINKNTLQSDGKLLKKIKEQIERETHEETKASYGIYSTDYEQDYLYVLAYSLEIQK
tara:strand:+ start:1465 stop:2328 length:864 start_codon:yes stop_codon:yes gene_type:complete